MNGLKQRGLGGRSRKWRSQEEPRSQEDEEEGVEV